MGVEGSQIQRYRKRKLEQLRCWIICNKRSVTRTWIRKSHNLKLKDYVAFEPETRPQSDQVRTGSTDHKLSRATFPDVSFRSAAANFNFGFQDWKTFEGKWEFIFPKVFKTKSCVPSLTALKLMSSKWSSTPGSRDPGSEQIWGSRNLTFSLNSVSSSTSCFGMNTELFSLYLEMEAVTIIVPLDSWSLAN